MWEMVLIWFQLFLRLASMLQIHGTRSRTQGRSTAECGAAVLSRAARVQRRKLALSGNKQSMSSAGFQSRAPNDSLRRETESSGEILQSCARYGRKTACARRRETAAPNAGGPPPRRRGGARAPDATSQKGPRAEEKQLHVHAVVDLLVVLGLLPRADARDVVAPIRMARRRVVVARPLGGLVDETHLFFIFIC